MSTLRLIISKNGDIRAIANDGLLPLLRQGKFSRARASHVEPDNNTGTWYADLSPVGGPKLEGFETHKAAIDAEIQWLLDHDIPLPEDLK